MTQLYGLQNDWGDDHEWPDKNGNPTMIRENIPKIRDVAYCFSKCDVERYLYEGTSRIVWLRSLARMNLTALN